MFRNYNLTRNHLIGFAAGVGTCAVGYYLYKKNETKVNEFLKKQGINVCTANKDITGMTLEELVVEKENIEDLIAEKEMISGELQDGIEE